MDSKLLKILIHASAFFAPFLVPIGVFVLTMFLDVRDVQVKRLSIQALLFQLVMGLLIFVSVTLSAVLIGIPFLIVFGIMTIVVPIIGIIKAIKDEPYNYPIVGRWI